MRALHELLGPVMLEDLRAVMLDLLLKLFFPIILLLLFLHPLLFCILQPICKNTTIVLLQRSTFKRILKLTKPLLLPFTDRLEIFLLVMSQFLPIPFASHLLVGLQSLPLLLFHHP